MAPTLTLSGAGAVNEASTYTLNLAASDPGQDTIANWTITWGDGSVQTVAGNPGSVSHTYADGPQTYTITATASDEDGTYNAGNSLNVTVNNVAPTASLSGPATGARGQVRTFTLGAADPSADRSGRFVHLQHQLGRRQFADEHRPGKSAGRSHLHGHRHLHGAGHRHRQGWRRQHDRAANDHDQRR